MNTLIIVREGKKQDSDWIMSLLNDRWGGSTMIVHGETIDLMELPCLVAEKNLGLLTYRIVDKEAELTSLDAVEPGKGVGSALLNYLTNCLSKKGIESLWVTTTNDNLSALRFYQLRGFKLGRLRAGAVDDARIIKPSIPLNGDFGIPISDELDLCLRLHR